MKKFSPSTVLKVIMRAHNLGPEPRLAPVDYSFVVNDWLALLLDNFVSC